MPHQGGRTCCIGGACFSLPTPACGRIFHPRLAGQPEIALKVPFPLSRLRKTLYAFRDLYDALLALALLLARSGNLYAQVLCAIEERGTVSRLGGLSVDGDSYQSALASNSAFTASATSSAEPSRSCLLYTSPSPRD